MNKLFTSLMNMSQVDEYGHLDTFIHHLHPLVKMMMTTMILVCLISTKSIIELLIYLFLVLFITKCCQIPIKQLLKRGLLGLPLCLCLGLSYLLLNQNKMYFYGFYINEGIILCLLLFLKTFLCLSLAYLLIITTSFDELTCELVFLKVPAIFVLQLVMTYRYIYLLLEEATLMARSYLLRSLNDQAIQMKDMGSFVGHLLVGSMKQSQDIYHCMKCRGFDIEITYQHHQKINSEDVFIMMIGVGILMMIKVVCI